jgi:hypothetical protein
MLNRFLLIAIATACIILSIRSMSSASGSENSDDGFKRELYKVELDESIMNRPALAAVWQQYGQMKASWRAGLFQAEFPGESKYRLTLKEELECRKHLAEQWEQLKATNPKYSDKYLDNLVKAKNSPYFKEYIYSYFKKGHWKVDKDKLHLDEFRRWSELNMKGPKEETRVKIVKIEFAEW